VRRPLVWGRPVVQRGERRSRKNWSTLW
jgi:hypothetical protein